MKTLHSNPLFSMLKNPLPDIKKLKVLFLVLLLFSGTFFLASFRSTENGNSPGEYITMRVYENFTVTSSRIIIVYADDKSEVIALEPFKYNDNYLVRNNQVITHTLNKLRKEGYRIVISSASGKVSSGRDMMITTYILER